MTVDPRPLPSGLRTRYGGGLGGRAPHPTAELETA